MANIYRRRTMPLWDARWDEATLRQKSAEMPKQAFDRGFRQRPFSEEDRLFSLDKIADATKNNLSVDNIKEMDGLCWTGVDISGTKRPGVAFFTIKIVRVDRMDVKVPVDIRLGTFAGKAFIDQFLDIERDWKPQVFMVENNNTQGRIIDMLSVTDAASLPVDGFFTGKQKFDPNEGLPSLSVEFERGLWRIPWRGRGRRDNPPDGHGHTCRCGWCTWYYDELSVFPMAESTDCLMAMWFAREAWRKYNMSGPYFEVVERPQVAGQFHL